jgi:hypothetical protein
MRNIDLADKMRNIDLTDNWKALDGSISS